jgi:hypothetical protein
MVPRNWTQHFFEWTAPAEQDLFELRLEVDSQTNPLVVYVGHSAGHDLKITLRSASFQGSPPPSPSPDPVTGRLSTPPRRHRIRWPRAEGVDAVMTGQ